MDFYEREAIECNYTLIAGVDEAGRGCLAGPVVAAAVLFDSLPLDLPIKDSKSLSPQKREDLFEEIHKRAISVGVGVVDAETIEGLNILKATLKAMKIAVENLTVKPQFLLIDGNMPIELTLPQRPVIKGDSKSITIASASIVAKVTRDRLMKFYHKLFSVYGFNRHKGYGTELHLKAIRKFGPSPIHRKTFRGVKEYVEG